MILAGNLLEARADQTIYKTFQNTFYLVTKIQIKVRKPPDSTTAVRRAIALVDDITLRCNHSTNHVGWSVEAPQGIEIEPANEFHEFRGLNPSAASIFLKISSFQTFPFMDQIAWPGITFLFRNA